jgi:hypothetical protein
MEGGDVVVRSVEAMMVRELSLQVAWPAYPGTERSLHGAGIEVSRASPE